MAKLTVQQVLERKYLTDATLAADLLAGRIEHDLDNPIIKAHIFQIGAYLEVYGDQEERDSHDDGDSTNDIKFTLDGEEKTYEGKPTVAASTALKSLGITGTLYVGSEEFVVTGKKATDLANLELTTTPAPSTFVISAISIHSAAGSEIGEIDPPGTVTTDKNEYSAGEEVVLTISLNKGYTLHSITARPAVGKDIEIDIDDIENLKFTMPESDVTLDVRVTTSVVSYNVGISMWSAAGHSEFPGEYVENVYTTEAGTARVNVDKPIEGDSVVLEIKPNSGYDLNSITVFPASAAGQEFSVDITDPESYPTFEMPGYDVDVCIYFCHDQSQEQT